MVQEASCGVEKVTTTRMFGVPQEMHWASLLFLKKISIETSTLASSVVLALFYCYVQYSNNLAL